MPYRCDALYIQNGAEDGLIDELYENDIVLDNLSTFGRS
jgi:hypothetical protein